MRVEWAARSDPGVRRPTNEDSYVTRPDLGLFVVADGMGGHVAGEVASRIVVQAIEAFIADTVNADAQSTWPVPFDPALSIDANRLKGAFHLANERLAAFKMPRTIKFLERLPRNPSGKVMKRDL